MYFKRKIDAFLEEWADDPEHKPLLLRGARQIGKTTAVRHLAERFETYIEINFETDEEIGRIFDHNFDIARICYALEVYSGKKMTPGKTLLFLDEIQVCPRAISCLRYFYENKQTLHVIATGSLLEFAFGEISDFGVGRIRNMFMHPLSFSEFATAMGMDLTMKYAREASFAEPLLHIGHGKLLELLKDFLVVGGMPAAVSRFINTKSFIRVQEQHNDIIASLKSDFGKYKKRMPSTRVLMTLQSVIDQTCEKFTYTDSDAGLDYRQAKECTMLLEMAKLIYRVDACHANGIPIGGDIKGKSNKFLFMDTGLYLTMAGLDLAKWILDEPAQFVNRGRLAEMFVGLELAKSGSPLSESRLFYWHREARGANAEVDYVVQFQNKVLPIEVKAGVRGSMKSLRIMMEEKHLDLGVRTSEENFGTIGNVCIIPLYLIGEYAAILGRNEH